MKARYLIY